MWYFCDMFRNFWMKRPLLPRRLWWCVYAFFSLQTKMSAYVSIICSLLVCLVFVDMIPYLHVMSEARYSLEDPQLPDYGGGKIRGGKIGTTICIKYSEHHLTTNMTAHKPALFFASCLFVCIIFIFCKPQVKPFKRLRKKAKK